MRGRCAAVARCKAGSVRRRRRRARSRPRAWPRSLRAALRRTATRRAFRRRPGARRSTGLAPRAARAPCEAPCRSPPRAGRRSTRASAARTRGVRRAPPPMRSPTRISASPQSFATDPAETDGRWTVEPSSKTSVLVTLPSVPAPNGTRSRVRIVPANMRTYAIFSPLPPRSILKIKPEAGAAGSPAGTASSSATAAPSSSTPTPFSAEPKSTGWTSERRVWSPSASRIRDSGIVSPCCT